tara:strand:- start:312 stop:734 length:423 start_codon:yes stop_codon:yes gene_type:complete
VKAIAATAMLFLCSGCWRTIAPTVLATAGAGIGGAVAGPGGAAAGAATGSLAGQVISGEGEVQEVRAELKALTTGDVEALIQLQAGKSKSGFDAVVDGIYRVLWLLGIGMAIWFVLPWIWAKSHVKKAVAKELNGVPAKS